MTKMEAIKQFFGDIKPVTNAELIELRREDKVGYDELGILAIKALGGDLTETPIQ